MRVQPSLQATGRNDLQKAYMTTPQERATIPSRIIESQAGTTDVQDISVQMKITVFLFNN
uniref:Uncharacterized protein n=1 Tax=Setaria italica TaxID=4555 RepID=K3Y0S2_SETIT